HRGAPPVQPCRQNPRHRLQGALERPDRGCQVVDVGRHGRRLGGRSGPADGPFGRVEGEGPHRGPADAAILTEDREEAAMTAKADSTPEEWQAVLEGPPSAGMIVVTAQRGGTIRETMAMAKTYVEARRQHGESEPLDEIASAKPEIDHTRYHSAEELRE